MKAMILAAGLGKRMLPLTANTPKPLLKVAGRPLIEWVIRALSKAGIEQIVINHAYLGADIVDFVKDGAQWGVTVHYSAEGEPLETAGGIARALDQFNDDPFVVVNADVYTDYDFSKLRRLSLPNHTLAHLVMVDNPSHHPSGDFSISNDGRLKQRADIAYTFSGISLLSPLLFKKYQCDSGPLAPLFLDGIADGLISAEYFQGKWFDVGTPERLHAINAQITAQ